MLKVDFNTLYVIRALSDITFHYCPPLDINLSHQQSMCCSDKYMSVLTTVLKYISWWEDVALDEAGFVVTWGRSLAQYKSTYSTACSHGVSHHQLCLVSSSVFLEVTVLFTSCSVCSTPMENYRPHVCEGEGKEKESPQKSYYCLQLWGCHERGLSGLCCHLWLEHTHWAQFGWQCVHGLCSRR